GRALVLADVVEVGLDLQLVEGALQERVVAVEAQQVELTGRRHADLAAGGGEVVAEGAVAALAGGLQVALDELAGGLERQELAPQLLRLGEAEVGLVDVDGDPAHPAVLPGGAEGREELGDALGAGAAGER